MALDYDTRLKISSLIEENKINDIISLINNTNDPLLFIIDNILRRICWNGTAELFEKIIETYNIPRKMIVYDYRYYTDLISDASHNGKKMYGERYDEGYKIVKFIIEKYNLSKYEILAEEYGQTVLWDLKWSVNSDFIRLIIEKANVTPVDIENSVGYDDGCPLMADISIENYQLYAEYGLITHTHYNILSFVKSNSVNDIIDIISRQSDTYDYIDKYYVIPYICKHGTLKMLKKIINKFNVDKKELNKKNYGNLLVYSLYNQTNSFKISEYIINKYSLSAHEIYYGLNYKKKLIDHIGDCVDINTFRLFIEKLHVFLKAEEIDIVSDEIFLNEDMKNILFEYSLITKYGYL